MNMALNTNSTAEQVTDEVMQWVTFTLNTEIFGANVMKVQEVIRYTQPTAMPGAPDYVQGIISLRGNVVTVIDARARFGLAPATITESTRIIIIEAQQQVIGIVVDSVSDVVYLRGSEISSSPNVGARESVNYIEGVSKVGDKLLILVALENLLSDDDWEQISNLSSALAEAV